MRPTYETKEDFANEAAVAAAVERAWGVTTTALKPFYGLDRAVFTDGKMTGILEIKCRNYSYKKIDGWGGLIISASKILAASQWHRSLRMTFALALGLPDGVFAMWVNPDDEWPVFEIALAGRTDRGDAHDIEPCCLIPMARFTAI